MICNRCVMDDTAAEFVKTETSCNFCDRAEQSLKENKEQSVNLQSIIDQIKKDGEDRLYDCLMGLSGGLDSSTTIEWAISNGLRPLCFTFDNAYNTPEADHNVKQLVEKLKLEHLVIQINQEQYTRLQEAFFKSGVRNCEIPTDHILMALTYETAHNHGIKWILSGGNTNSESIMPESWGYQPKDLTHIKDIFKKMTGEELLGLPLCSIWKWNDYKWTEGIQTFYPLDYINYNLAEAKTRLKLKYDWKDYGEKHEESIFTGWFQNVVLPKRWGIDKRKAHLSSLIVSGQMSRAEALEKLSKEPKQFEFPIKGLDPEVLMAYPKHEHSDYAQETWYEDIAKMIKEKYGK